MTVRRRIGKSVLKLTFWKKIFGDLAKDSAAADKLNKWQDEKEKNDRQKNNKAYGTFQFI